jgi:hypothetical protein
MKKNIKRYQDLIWTSVIQIPKLWNKDTVKISKSLFKLNLLLSLSLKRRNSLFLWATVRQNPEIWEDFETMLPFHHGLYTSKHTCFTSPISWTFIFQEIC